MKKYFNLPDFITFLTILEDNKPTKLYTESKEDGSIADYIFMKIKFNNNDIILYDTPYGCAGIIQDIPVAPWVDYAKGVFEDLVCYGKYKVFIE